MASQLPFQCAKNGLLTPKKHNQIHLDRYGVRKCGVQLRTSF